MSGTYRAPRHIAALDGLRALSVIAVATSHLPMATGPWVYNVLWQINQVPRFPMIMLDMFFSLSGFLITRLLLAERLAEGTISLRRFYVRRSMRIFPVFYLTLVVTWLVFRFDAENFVALGSYTFNLYHPWVPVSNPLEHAWSLCVEEQFYLMWPFLISRVPLRWLPAVTRGVVPAVAVVSGLILGVLVTDDPLRSGNVVYMGPLTRMLSLSLGAWVAVREAEGRPFFGWPCGAMMAAGVVLLTLDRLGRNHGIVPSQGIYWTFALLGYALISAATVSTVVFDAGRTGRWVRRVLNPAPLRAIGRLSYSLYIVHLPVIFYFGLNVAAIGDGRASPVVILEAVAVTAALACASYYGFERPILRLRPGQAARTPATTPARLPVAG